MKFFGYVVFSSFILNAAELQKPFLRVHCDVNKTIICTDAVQGKGLEETVNGILSEFTFHNWDGTNTQSYYAFVTAVLAKEHPELSKASEAFKKKREAVLKEFPQFLEMFPTQRDQYHADRNKMMAVLNAEKTVIFPSFYKLITWLNTHYKNNHAVYLRTFGKDLPEIRPLIEKKSDLKFVDSGELKAGLVSMAAQRSGIFQPSHYSNFFKVTHESYCIKDDYDHWKSKGFQAEGGKPFPIGLNSQDIEIFFDDNADDAVKPIVCPVNPEGQMLDTNQLLKNGTIVPVNPKEAILDEDYFIKKLQARLQAVNKK